MAGFDLRSADLRRLESAAQYPSIPAHGRAEGLVLRGRERRQGIAKVKFRDYERTVRQRQQQKAAG